MRNRTIRAGLSLRLLGAAIFVAGLVFAGCGKQEAPSQAQPKSSAQKAPRVTEAKARRATSPKRPARGATQGRKPSKATQIIEPIEARQAASQVAEARTAEPLKPKLGRPAIVDLAKRPIHHEASGTKAVPFNAQKREPNHDELAEIETKFGTILVEFFPEAAPRTVENFKKLARRGFYDGTTFHRVIPGFVIQGGDPNSKADDRSNDGTGGPGYTIPAEFNEHKHLRGTVSMARGPDPDSAGSQFFICLKPQPHLDYKYTVFGQVIKGMDVVDKIASVRCDSRHNPIERIEMRVRIIKRPVVGPPSE